MEWRWASDAAADEFAFTTDRVASSGRYSLWTPTLMPFPRDF